MTVPLKPSTSLEVDDTNCSPTTKILHCSYDAYKPEFIINRIEIAYQDISWLEAQAIKHRGALSIYLADAER
jgi:hypothetical protein